MNLRLVGRYARALFKLAAERQVLYEVEEELSQVEQVFEEEEVRIFFENPSIPMMAKKAAIERLFGASVSNLVQNLLNYMIDKRRAEVLAEVSKAYRALVKEANNVLEVQITAASELSNEDSEQLTAQLAKVTRKDIELKVNVDPRILGGLIVQIGDKWIDNSVVGKLAALKSHMLNKSF